MSGLSFGRFELRPASRQLWADGNPIAIGARAYDLLQALIERRERMVTKGELLDLVWPGLVVEENNLQVQISALRKLLGPQAIATIPGRGYQFTLAPDAAGTDARAVPATPPVAAARAQGASRDLTNLPPDAAPLYGRAAELAALCPLIDARRLVTVVGAGGIGKSRLADAAARVRCQRWREGVWLVELAGLADPALVPQAVARALGVALPGRAAPLEELVSALAPRSLLIVLDNCEHLLEAAAEVVQALLQRAPNVAVLATSQEPLRLPNEQQYRLTPLAVPTGAAVRDAREFGAVALLEARVRAANPRFALDAGNLPDAIDICRRLDGLPLAIELAAARVATLGLRPVRDKLDARFRLLTGGTRATLRRHQTLRAALEWSHNLLNDDERAVFRRLGVFVGGFTVEMAQAVATDAQRDEWAVLDHLCALVDKSLVVADPGDAPRYRLLESARAFALEQLAAGETTEMLGRHARAMAAFLERVDAANLDGELRSDQYAAQVLPELDNLRAAHAWAAGEGGDRVLAIALAAHAGSVIDYANECVEWLLAKLPQIEGERLEPALAARFWRAVAAANITGHVSRGEQAAAALRACTLYAALGRTRRVFGSLIQLTRHRVAQGELGPAQQSADEARALLRPDWPPEFRIMQLRVDAGLATATGRLTDALAYHRECAAASAAAGDWRLEVIARSNLADGLWLAGKVDDAAREACALAEELRTRPAAASEMAILHANALGILCELGRIDDAVALADEALECMRRCGEYFLEEWTYLSWRRGRTRVAAQLLGAVDRQVGRSGVPLQLNEQRLLAEVRRALAGEMPPEALAGALAAGAALDKAGLFALISESLA